MNKKEFNKVARIYLSEKAKPLEIEETTYRGCLIWTFKRNIRKWRRPTAAGKWMYDKGECKYNNIPEDLRNYYIYESWESLSDYFLKFDCEFENECVDTIGRFGTRQETLWATQTYITNHYAENIIAEQNIM